MAKVEPSGIHLSYARQVERPASAQEVRQCGAFRGIMIVATERRIQTPARRQIPWHARRPRALVASIMLQEHMPHYRRPRLSRCAAYCIHGIRRSSNNVGRGGISMVARHLLDDFDRFDSGP
jgi:hypothetical protein